VFTDDKCDCVKVIFIRKHDRTLSECLLTASAIVLS